MRKAFIGLRNRLFQCIAHFCPGALSLRVWLHRWRGVKIGRNVWIGYDVILDNTYPELITLGDNVVLSMRAMLIAHFQEQKGIVIEPEAFIGPGTIILPGVTVGRGAVITAGSVVSSSVPPMTVMRGNPALPIATCGTVLVGDTTLKQFYRSLRPIKAPASKSVS